MLDFLETIDRRIIYLFVLISLSIPLALGVTMKPAPLPTSEAFYKAIETLDGTKDLVLISSDWGPNTKAENQPQTEVAIEHLMRKRVPFVMTSLYPLAEPFLKSVPYGVAERLAKEFPGETWEYGKDWINVGYRPGGSNMIQTLAKTSSLAEYWKADANGTPIESLPLMKPFKDIRDIKLLLEFTGLVGAFDAWIGFFSVTDHRPDMLHGCTSITIPEARTYFSSKQIIGLFEGVAGAAYYEYLLTQKYPKREVGEGWKTNTGLAFAQLVIISFIILGNLGMLVRRFRHD